MNTIIFSPISTISGFQSYLAIELRYFMAMVNEIYCFHACTIQKKNCTCYGINVRKKDFLIGFNMEIEPFYEAYQKGTSLNEILKDISDMIHRQETFIKQIDISWLIDFQKSGEYIYPALINDSINQECLKELPHQYVNSLNTSIIYFVRTDKAVSKMSKLLVTEKQLDLWGIDRETLHDKAIRNLQKQALSLDERAETGITYNNEIIKQYTMAYDWTESNTFSDPAFSHIIELLSEHDKKETDSLLAQFYQ